MSKMSIKQSTLRIIMFFGLFEVLVLSGLYMGKFLQFPGNQAMMVSLTVGGTGAMFWAFETRGK